MLGDIFDRAYGTRLRAVEKGLGSCGKWCRVFQFPCRLPRRKDRNVVGGPALIGYDEDEAFSEGAGIMGRLRFASARAEINVMQRRDGRIVRADRVTTRGVDLAK